MGLANYKFWLELQHFGGYINREGYYNLVTNSKGPQLIGQQIYLS